MLLDLGDYFMNRERKCEIQCTQPGVLTYRQGGTEFRFPVYEEDGETVFVAWPTSKRIFLYFAFGGWTLVPKEFPRAITTGSHDRSWSITAATVLASECLSAPGMMNRRCSFTHNYSSARVALLICSIRPVLLGLAITVLSTCCMRSSVLKFAVFGKIRALKPSRGPCVTAFPHGTTPTFASRTASGIQDGSSHFTCFHVVAVMDVAPMRT
jgi:hypothetical protein